MSSQDPAGDYCPRLESAVDSFGAAIAIWDDMSEVAGTVPDTSPRMVLQVGDVVTFTCSGIDPKGRDLEWKLSRSGGGNETVVVGPSGEPVELVWHVDDGDVGESVAVSIHMSAAGGRYRRWGWFDHRTYFRYVV